MAEGGGGTEANTVTQASMAVALLGGAAEMEHSEDDGEGWREKSR